MEARRAGERAAQIADELDDDVVLRSTASIGVAVARLMDGDIEARADLLAASDVGLAHRLDDLATTPISNLCHIDVEQGRFGRCRRVGRARPADQRGARHSDLQCVANRVSAACGCCRDAGRSGRIWVDATDFAVMRIEAEPAKNPSFWTKETQIEQIYSKVGDFWLPRSNRSTTTVRLGGHASFTIDYGEYRITAVNPSRPPGNDVAGFR